MDPKYNGVPPSEAEGALRDRAQRRRREDGADCSLVKCSLCVVVTVISYLWVGGSDL